MKKSSLSLTALLVAGVLTLAGGATVAVAQSANDGTTPQAQSNAQAPAYNQNGPAPMWGPNQGMQGQMYGQNGQAPMWGQNGQGQMWGQGHHNHGQNGQWGGQGNGYGYGMNQGQPGQGYGYGMGQGPQGQWGGQPGQGYGYGMNQGQQGQGYGYGMGQGMNGERAGGAFVNGRFATLSCSEQGSQRIGMMLTQLEQRLDLTDDQQALFDTFFTSATDAQASYLETCQTVNDLTAADNASETTAPNPADLLKLRAENLKAEASALDSVVPSATAFFDSLTADQLALMVPQPQFANR